MWPTLHDIFLLLPEGTTVQNEHPSMNVPVSGTLLWDGKSFPQFQSSSQILLAEPDVAVSLLRWGSIPLSRMVALITRMSVKDSLVESLKNRGIFVFFLPDDFSLEQTQLQCNTYILNYISSFLSGEISFNKWPQLSTLYFSSHFENMLNGMQYIDTGVKNQNQDHLLPNGPYYLLLIRFDDTSFPQGGKKDQNQIFSQFLSYLDMEILEFWGNTYRLPISVRENSDIILLFSSSTAGTIHEASVIFTRFIAKLRNYYSIETGGGSLSSVYTSEFYDLGTLYSHYNKCLFSCDLYQDLYGCNHTICTKDMTLYFNFLNRLNDSNTKYMFQRHWNFLQNYDLKNKTELCITLENYIKSNGISSDAAKSLNVHRNTMRNRLSCIEQLLNIDLLDPETFFYLGVCLRIKAAAKYSSNYNLVDSRGSTNLGMQSIAPISKEIQVAYDLLNRYDTESNSVLDCLRSNGINNISVERVEVNQTFSEFLRIFIPGVSGKAAGGNSPTIGIIGRISGIKMENQPLALVSDADGAIVAIALALSLSKLCASGNEPFGDIIITTQIALHSSAKDHSPAPLTSSQIDTLIACEKEVDPAMDAILSVSVCRATHWVNVDGIAITPTVKKGYILPPPNCLLKLMETVTGKRPVVFPITTYDITPADNGLYHVNSIVQPALKTDKPVVGIALTSSNLIPGITLRHNDLANAELATRFTLETIYGYTSNTLELYDENEFTHAVNQYGFFKYTEK